MVSVGLGGFLSLMIGAVASAVLPPSVSAPLVAPYACPAGTQADIDRQDTQCNEHNRNSGTCQTVLIECYGPGGKLVEKVHPNTSVLLVFGVYTAYLFAFFGTLLFAVTFFGVALAGWGLGRFSSRVAAGENGA